MDRYILLLLAMFITTPAEGFEPDVNTVINPTVCDKVLINPTYSVCYSFKHRSPIFDFYVLDGTKVNSVNIKKRKNFTVDKRIPVTIRTHYKDYRSKLIKLDRGHLYPDAAADYDPNILKTAYKLSNIIPQYYKINRRTWKYAEERARRLAVQYGSVSVINKVIYGLNLVLTNTGLEVPTAYWKMIYTQNMSECYYYENNQQWYNTHKTLLSNRVDCNKL